MQIQEPEEPLVPKGFKPEERSCAQCVHVRVCSIRAVVGRYLDTDYPVDKTKPLDPRNPQRPFNPDELARVCAFYLKNYLSGLPVAGD